MKEYECYRGGRGQRKRGEKSESLVGKPEKRNKETMREKKREIMSWSYNSDTLKRCHIYHLEMLWDHKVITISHIAYRQTSNCHDFIIH